MNKKDVHPPKVYNSFQKNQ